MNLPCCAGVYKLTAADGAVYVGSSMNVRRRIASHRTELRAGRHCNPRLLRAAREFGADSISAELIECCDPGDLLRLEQEWINALDPQLNQTLCARNPMLDPASAAKQAAALRGRATSAETRAKISAALKGRKKSPEWVEKMSAVRRGKKLSPEHRQALSAAHRGKPKSEQHRAALRAAAAIRWGHA